MKSTMASPIPDVPITEEYLSLKMATCKLGKHFVFVFLPPLMEDLHGTMPSNVTQMKASSMTSLPWQADFRTTPGLMLCSIICTRSALASEGGHQISVNLFLRAGDSCKRKKKSNIVWLSKHVKAALYIYNFTSCFVLLILSSVLFFPMLIPRNSQLRIIFK